MLTAVTMTTLLREAETPFVELRKIEVVVIVIIKCDMPLLRAPCVFTKLVVSGILLFMVMNRIESTLTIREFPALLICSWSLSSSAGSLGVKQPITTNWRRRGVL